jgi:hypothetical protein
MNSKTKTALERLTERIVWFLESDDATLEDMAEVVGRQEAKALLNAARDAMMGEEILDLIAYHLPSKD